MLTKEQLKLFKEKYEKKFDQALADEDKNKVREILSEWRKERDKI